MDQDLDRIEMERKTKLLELNKIDKTINKLERSFKLDKELKQDTINLCIDPENVKCSMPRESLCVMKSKLS